MMAVCGIDFDYTKDRDAMAIINGETTIDEAVLQLESHVTITKPYKD